MADKLETVKQDFLMGKAFLGAVGMHNFYKPLSPSVRSQSPVTACHILMTAPCVAVTRKPFSMPLHAQLTAELSARLWKRYNGPIRLITDAVGARYFKSLGLDKVYDEVVCSLVDLYGLNQRKFWASGKLLALENLTLPCAVIDMDMLIWQPLPLEGKPLAVTHTERLNDRYYPSPGYFIMNPRYRFPSEWDWQTEPFNTSILYMEDEGLKAHYLSESLRFMRFERDTPDDGSICMIFAEQRILAMCARQRGVRATTFLNLDTPLAAQSLITHIWSGKHFMSRYADVEASYNELCREKLRQLADF